jgi:hypothetical protein
MTPRARRAVGYVRVSRVGGRASLRQLTAAVVADSKGILTAALTFGVTASEDLPNLVAAALDVAVPVTAAVGRAA